MRPVRASQASRQKEIMRQAAADKKMTTEKIQKVWPCCLRETLLDAA